MPKAFPHPTKQKNHYSPDSSAASGKYDLGVLFVHGIGQQPQGDTLALWGEALIDWILRVDSNPKEETKVTVLEASLGAGQGKPAETDVEVTINGKSRRWLMSEAWWAMAFATPSYRQLVVWSTKIVPWAIGLHVARHFRSRVEALVRVWLNRGAQSPAYTSLLFVEALFRLVFATVALIVGMLLSPLLLLFLSLLLLIGLIPIPKLRTFVNVIQQRLAGSIGDSMVLLESPIQSAAMRSRLRDTLQILAKKCKQVALVAHSQGAEIAVETLLETPPITKKRTSGRWPPHGLTTLITFGAGVNKLGLLRYLRDLERGTSHSDAKGIGPGHPWRVTFFLLVLSILVVAIYMDVMAKELQLHHFWPIPYLLAVGPLCYPVVLLVRYAAMKVGADKPLANKIAIITGVVLVLIATGWLIYLEPEGKIIFFVLAFIYAMAPLIAFVQFSKSVEKTIPASIPFLEHWYDFYGSADPVPNGPIPHKQEDRSVEIHNVESLLSDHTFYWKNREEFVGPVTACLAAIVGTPFKNFGMKGKEFEAGKMRRRVRVGWLRVARWAVIVAAALYATQKVAAADAEAKHNWDLSELARPLRDLTYDFLTSSRLTSWIVSPLPENMAVVLAGLTVITSVALLTYWLLLGIWVLWDDYAGRNFPRHYSVSAAGRIKASSSELVDRYFLYLWVPLLLCVVGLPFLIEETVTQIPHLISGTAPAKTESSINIGYWLLFVGAGGVLAWLVMKGLLPGRPDCQGQKVPSSR